MYYRPWLLILIAIAHCIEPVTKVLFYSLIHDMTPWSFTKAQFQSGDALHIIAFFFLFPVAGIAIYSIKKWSLPVFLIAEIWVFISNFSQLKILTEQNQIADMIALIFFTMLNIAVVSYILTPSVRIAYTDPKVRWWEAFPRYAVRWPCHLQKEQTGTIYNISQGGVFLKPDKKIHINQMIQMSFTALGQSIEIEGFVIHAITVNKIKGIGVEFRNTSHQTKRQIAQILATLDRTNAVRRPVKRDHLNSFSDWIKGVSKGKGLMPELPQTLRQSKNNSKPSKSDATRESA